MSFAQPLALLLLLLLIPAGWLYWLRLQLPRPIVGTGLFWQKALAEEPKRARWQRWRPGVSLAVQLATFVLLVLAAAGPQIPPARRIVLILDNSATMRASDLPPTRFDAAKNEARRLIASLRWCDQMAIVTTSPMPQEVLPMSGNKKALGAAVESAQVAAEPPAIAWAVKLAREIYLANQPPPHIVLLTDACEKDAACEALGNGVDVLRVGTPASNRAITGFTARRSMLDPVACEVFVEVGNQGDQSPQCTVTLSIDGKPGPSASFTIKKDDCWWEIFEVKLPAAARLTATITPADDYPFDDTAELDVPAPPAPHVVQLANPQSCLKEILAANGRVKLAGGDTAAKAIQVIDGDVPAQLPSGPVLVFSPGACDLWQLGEAVADPAVTHVDEASPITAGVRLLDAYLPEARQLELDKSVGDAAKPILWAGKTPLGYRIDRPQGRVVVICGNLATSNLPLQADFSKLVAQALDWLDGQAPW